MLARLVRRCGVAALFMMFAASPLLAQATGKLQGRVVEAETGAPIAGVSVQILGTSQGAISSEDGFYFINEVPAGLYTIIAQFIGRRTIRVEDQRILSGQTMTVDFEMPAAPIELEELVVQGERNPLVPRDQVSSKAIITGELIEALPVSSPAEIINLQPGVIVTNQGRTIRGSRPNEEAVYIDGVLVKRYGTGRVEPIELPINALEEASVTTGGVGAQFADAQSGVVNYVTRSGGTSLSGSLWAFSDQMSPKTWRTGNSRIQANLGGPIWRDKNLTFFLAGVVEGRKYLALNDGWNDVPQLLNSGVASLPTDPNDPMTQRIADHFGMEPGDPAIFTLPRGSQAAGGEDSVTLQFPSFTAWDNGPSRPFNPSDEYTALAKVTWAGLGAGNYLDLSWKRERDQRITLGLGNFYNPQGVDGTFGQADVWTLGGYFLLVQRATSALALDLRASYQKFFNQNGPLDPQWYLDHREPFGGFNLSNMKFLVDADDFPVSRALMEGARSNAFPAESLLVYPGRSDLRNSQAPTGITDPLRFNPYGLRTDFPVRGFGTGGTTGLSYQRERNWVFSGTLDWQASRTLRIQAGGDYALIDLESMFVPLESSRGTPEMYDPKRGGLFATGRLDLGDVVIDAGLRFDYFDPSGDFPRVPGYVFNVPDSLKADFVTLEAFDPDNPKGFESRLVPLENCGGDVTAADRTREDGTVVCKPNFIAASSKSTISPRLGVAFPVTVKSTFRFSYSHNVQTPPLGSSDFGVVTGQFGYFRNIYDDLAGGRANTNTDYGRDIDLPRTVFFEAGYRQLIGESLVLDLAAYSKTTRNGITIRKVSFENPNFQGQNLFINSMVNADYTQIRGIDFRTDWRAGRVFNLAANYSFIDARGTGSDPFTYIDLLFRRNTNVSVVTGQPVIPPDVILPLEQSRTHTVAGTAALLFPTDFQRGTAVGAIFSDFGVFATGRVSSGLNFTMLDNRANGQTGPPTFAGLGGTVAEELNSSNMPWEKRLDLRFTKGFSLGARTKLLVFLDWSNPLNIANTNRIFLETGNANNSAFRDKIVGDRMADENLDGDTQIRDFDILSESPENPVNVFSLLQAERRYGDGDGVFTVDEQRTAFGAFYDLFWGTQNFVESTQRLRLGIGINF